MALPTTTGAATREPGVMAVSEVASGEYSYMSQAELTDALWSCNGEKNITKLKID
jgi:hypothetical protein